MESYIKIISLDKNEKVPSMYKVSIENNISFCLPKKRVELLELTEGKVISEETLNYILDTEVYAAAKSAAVSFLALKLRTAYEVEQKLSEMGYDEATIERVIENLKEISYIDDYSYAGKYIAEKTKLKPKSAKLLSMELGQKGISDDIISSAFEAIQLDEEAVAVELLRKKYAKYSSFDEKTIQKMKTFLMSRGFGYSLISRAISIFLPDE